MALDDGLDRDGSRIGGHAPQWWLGACVVALLIASDYRLRSRDPGDALGGGADFTVLLEIATYAAVGLALFFSVAHSWRPVPNRRLLFCLFAFSGVLGVSVVHSPFLMFSAVRAAQLVLVTALAYVAALHATTRHFATLVRAFTLLVGLSVLLGLALPFERSGPAGSRFTWLHVHPVVSGTYLALAVLLLVCHVTASGDPGRFGWRRPLQVLLLVVCVGGLLATQTRGSIFAAVVGCVVAIWSRSTARRRVDLLIGGAVVTTLLTVAAGPAIRGFLERGESPESLATLNSRTDLWGHMFEMIAEEPIFGHGLEASQGVLIKAIGLGGGHNAVMNLLLDTGMIGVIAWLTLVTALIRYLLVLRRDPRSNLVASTLLGATALLLVNSVTTEDLVVPATVASTWFYLIVAWTLVLMRENREDDVEQTEALDHADQPDSSPGRQEPLDMDWSW